MTIYGRDGLGCTKLYSQPRRAWILLQCVRRVGGVPVGSRALAKIMNEPRALSKRGRGGWTRRRRSDRAESEPQRGDAAGRRTSEASRGRPGRSAQRLIATSRSSLAPVRVVHILREGVLGDRKVIGCVLRSDVLSEALK